MDKAVEIIKKHIGKDDRIGVAVSGGVDSMCLLHILMKFGGFEKENIYVLNVEHGIRGEQSVSDSAFVENYAFTNGLNFIGEIADVPSRREMSGRSEESEARIVRKEFFARLIDEKRVDWILTAHHLTDRTEGVLMHIFRGSGINGLIGMGERDGRFLHPLIFTPKSEIDAYARDNGVPFVTDATNFDDGYTRNFLRLNVIPKINERYDLDSALTLLSRNAASDEAFIRSCMKPEKYIDVAGGVVKLDISALDLPYALKSRYVFEAAKMLGFVTDIEQKHVDAVLELKNLQNGKRVDMGRGLVAAREYDCIAFFISGIKPQEEEREVVPFAVGFTPFGGGVAEILPADTTLEEGKLKIDGDAVPDGAVIRFRLAGDTFSPFGGSGTKKLKDYFIDRKIPLRNRDKIPLLCYNEKVLAVFGVEIADEVKITEKTTGALTLEYTED